MFHSIGIAGRDGEAEFFAPANAAFVSFSVSPDLKRQLVDKICAKVLRLESITFDLGEPPPDIFKMDIEGFEYDVLADNLSDPIRPAQVLVEFHHGMYGIGEDRTRATVDDLRNAIPLPTSQ